MLIRISLTQACSGHRRGLMGILLLATTVLGTGCGTNGQHPTAKVHGIVTLNGDPLEFGSILFMPEGNFPSAEGTIKEDGTYDMGTYAAADGAVLGKHTVIINARVASGGSLPEDAVKGAAGTVSAIPERYGDPSKSGLIAEVQSGANEIDFELVTVHPKILK